MFVTTTVLDFVHAFRRKEPKDAMALAIARECKLARALLHAYAVMPHHVHMLATMHESMNVSAFMRRLKRQSGMNVMPLLDEAERRGFTAQTGLNGNAFWQRSFRSFEIEGDGMFWQKVEYIHMNPVEAGYVERPEDYVWSSARLLLAGQWREDTGIPYQAVVDSLGA